MGFYDLDKKQRIQKYADIQTAILCDIESGETLAIYAYFNDDDTYIRKAAYLAIGKLYKSCDSLRGFIVEVLKQLMLNKSDKVRQTVINSAGEIAMMDFESVKQIFETGLADKHHTVKNAVQGSLKKAGQKNHSAIVEFARNNILSSNPEIRRQLAHGLELRGRTHPEDIMPILRLLQFEKHKRVRPMIIHIFGQISYKKGCLEKVTAELLTWEDKTLAQDCFKAIIEQHRHVNNHFATIETLSSEECEKYIEKICDYTI